MLDADAQLPEWPLPRTCPMLPPPAFEELRKDPPQLIMMPDGLPAWLVTRHADAKQVLMDSRISASDKVPGFRDRVQLPPKPGMHSFWRMDPPDQTRLRSRVMPEFTARAIKALRPAIESTIKQLLDQMAEMPQPVDLLDAFAMPLPALVVARVFGVPDEDYRTFVDQSRTILSQGNPEKAYAAYESMFEYLERLTLSKVDNPGDDLLSRLANGPMASGELSLYEIISMVRLVLIAGHESTANQIALCYFTLLHQPDQKLALSGDPAHLQGFIEESMRYWTLPQDNILRTVVEEVEVGGTTMAPGDLVVIALPSANHDDRVFPQPTEFDLLRENAKAHLSLGIGAHFCPGAPLARAEMELAIPAVFERFPNLQLVGGVDNVPFRKNTLVYGVDALWVTW